MKQPWICPRCQVVNAPWKETCSCSPQGAIVIIPTVISPDPICIYTYPITTTRYPDSASTMVIY